MTETATWRDERSGGSDATIPAAPDDEFDRFASIACRVADAPVALVMLHDPDGPILPGASGIGEPYATRRRMSLVDTFSTDFVRTSRSVVHEDVLADPHAASSALVSELGARAYAGVPLTDADGTVAGVLCVIDTEPRDFTGRQLADLTDLAAICSSSVAARSVERRVRSTQHRATRISRLNRLLLMFSEALGETSTVEEIAATVTTLAHSALGVVSSALVLEREGEFVAIDDADLPADRPGDYSGIARTSDHPGPHCVIDRKARFFATRSRLLEEYPTLEGRTSTLLDAESFLPITIDGRACGWIFLGWELPREPIAEARELKIALAKYTGQALERADLLRERHEVAQTLQEAMLTRLPKTEAMTLAARYVPASAHEQVGGDWYDAIAAHGVVTLIIGDVVGHNIEAAAQMGHLRSILRGFVADRHEDPAMLLTRLDRANLLLDAATMATAVVLQVEPSAEPGVPARITWSSAGHPSPVVVDAAGNAREVTGTSDLLLGVSAEAPRRNHTEFIEPGTSIIMFTDGLVERRWSSITEMVSGLCTVASRHARKDLATMLDLIVTEMGDAREKDDVAVLAARLNPPT